MSSTKFLYVTLYYSLCHVVFSIAEIYFLLAVVVKFYFVGYSIRMSLNLIKCLSSTVSKPAAIGRIIDKSIETDEQLS